MAIRVMTKVWDQGPEDRTETIVLLCLADHANDEGQCYPSLDRISNRCRLSRQGTVNALKRLEENGWITKHSGGGRGNPNHYTIHLDRFDKGSSSLDGLSGEKGKADKLKGQADTEKGQADKDKGSSSLDGNRQGTVKKPSENRESAPAHVNGSTNGLRDHPAVKAHREAFPAVTRSRIQREKIVETVDDIELWGDVLEYWQMNSYKGRSIGRQLQKYREDYEPNRNNGKSEEDEWLDNLAEGG